MSRPWAGFTGRRKYFASVFDVPTRSARAPQKPLLPRRPSPTRVLQRVLHRGLTRSRPRAQPRPPLPRLALRRPDGEAVLGPHLHPDSSAYSNSSWCCTPCCRLWVWARPTPSTICQAGYHPTASPPAAAGSAHRRDPFSCRLVGPDGASTVRPRPRRACGNSSLTAYALS